MTTRKHPIKAYRTVLVLSLLLLLPSQVKARFGNALATLSGHRGGALPLTKQKLPRRDKHTSRSSAASAGASTGVPQRARPATARTDIATTTTLSSSSTSSSSIGLPARRQSQQILVGILVTVLALAVYSYREILLPLMDKQRIQEATLQILRGLLQPTTAPDGSTTTTVSWQSLGIYTAGMAAWEFFGLTTIPVETAAGMVFGFPLAFGASAAGKLAGAVAAFGTGRSCSGAVRRKLDQGNSPWRVLWTPPNASNNSSSNSNNSRQSPLATAFLMKFSCFPEAVKNFGSSLLPVQTWMFILATVVHGFTFTALWTWLGVDAAARLQDSSLPVNAGLNVALVVAAIVGVGLSPLLMAWWLRELKRQANAERNNKAAL